MARRRYAEEQTTKAVQEAEVNTKALANRQKLTTDQSRP